MTIWDDGILEYVRENDGAASVGTLADSEYVRVSDAHVSRRCRKLADRDFLRDLGNGVYQLTERGERYLDGGFDAAEDRPDESDDVFEGSEGGEQESNGERGP